MSTREEYERKLMGYLKDKLKRDSITLESKFKEDLEFDSLESVEMIMELEDLYPSTPFPEEVGASFVKVRDVVDYLSAPEAYIKSHNIEIKKKP